MNQRFLLLFYFVLSLAVKGWSQTGQGGTQEVQIIYSDRLHLRTVEPNTSIQMLAGNVQLVQGSTRFRCDSCVINSATKTFEAFGRVHINDSDTTQVYSNYLRYLSERKLAYLSGNVRLTDGKATLTTKDLEYDVSTKMATYRNGGRVVSKKSVLTSQEGVYYTDLRDVYFRKNVLLKDPAYTLRSDSLLFNSESQVATFITQTFIRDSSGRTIQTSEGNYDAANRKANFTSRTTIRDKALTVIGDRIASDDATGDIQVEGRGVLIDSAQGVSILANTIFANKVRNSILATQKPLMIIRQEKDSIYITADTLFSARLTDLYKSDSLKKKLGLKEKDSTNRYFEAFRNVRIFTDSVQAASDSLFYSFKDSTFHLYQDPVVWSRKSQITGDTIFLYTRNKKADRFKVFLNSFMVNEVDPGVYNQVKSVRMDGYFREGVIDSVLAKGAAESVYFLQDADSAYSGVNQTTSEAMDIYFAKGELNKVVFRRNLNGTMFPISQKPPSSMRLEAFRWLEERRPKTKYDLFQ